MSFNQASEDLKSFVKKLKPLIDLGDFLEKVGSLEQAASEAEAKYNKFLKFIDEAKVQIDGCSEELKKQESEYRKVLADIEVAKAKAEAKKASIVAEGKAQADEIIVKAYQMKSAVESEVKVLKASKEKIKEEIKAAQDEFAKVKAEVDSIKEKLSSFMK
jgi:chromosome segregation ATPase